MLYVNLDLGFRKTIQDVGSWPPAQTLDLKENECCIVREDKFSNEQYKVTHVGLRELEDHDDDDSALCSARKIGENIFVYGTRSTCNMIEWIKSFGMLIGNIVHTIFIKCLKVLFIKCFSSMGVKFDRDVQEKADRMWEGKSPIKSLVTLVAQIVINLLGILTLGLFSTEFNRISGDLERWAVGDTYEIVATKTYARRMKSKDYFAECQQPVCVLKKGTVATNTVLEKFKTGGKEQIEAEVLTDVPEKIIRGVLPYLINGSLSSIPQNRSNFGKES